MILWRQPKIPSDLLGISTADNCDLSFALLALFGLGTLYHRKLKPVFLDVLFF